MSLRLTPRQVGMLAEMGIFWPAAAAVRGEVLWVAVTANEPLAEEAQLLANIRASIEQWLDARTAAVSIGSIASEPPMLQWALQTFGVKADQQHGLMLFGDDVAERLLGQPGASERAALPANCTLFITRSLADLSSSAKDKALLWRALCGTPSASR